MNVNKNLNSNLNRFQNLNVNETLSRKQNLNMNKTLNEFQNLSLNVNKTLSGNANQSRNKSQRKKKGNNHNGCRSRRCISARKGLHSKENCPSSQARFQWRDRLGWQRVGDSEVDVSRLSKVVITVRFI
jgi:hypothetical protein